MSKPQKKEQEQQRKRTAEQLYEETAPYLTNAEPFDPLDPPTHLSSDAVRVITLFASLRDCIQQIKQVKDRLQQQADDLTEYLADYKAQAELKFVDRIEANLVGHFIEEDHSATIERLAVAGTALDNLFDDLMNGKNHPVLKRWRHANGRGGYRFKALSNPEHQAIVCTVIIAITYCKDSNGIHYLQKQAAQFVARKLSRLGVKPNCTAEHVEAYLEKCDRTEVNARAQEMAKLASYDVGTVLQMLTHISQY